MSIFVSCTGSGGGGKKDVKRKSKTCSEVSKKIEHGNPVERDRSRRKQQPEMHNALCEKTEKGNVVGFAIMEFFKCRMINVACVDALESRRPVNGIW